MGRYLPQGMPLQVLTAWSISTNDSPKPLLPAQEVCMDYKSREVFLD